jgi:thiol:disulfide interchange protein DsbD
VLAGKVIAMTRNCPNRGWRPVLALVVLLTAGSVLSAAPPGKDPFAPENAARPAAQAVAANRDPFALANAAVPLTAPRSADTTAAVGKPADKKPPATAERIDFKVELTPARVRRGETVQLTITGTPRQGYHTYPITQRADNEYQPPEMLSKIKFEDAAGLQPLYPIHESKPQTEQYGSLGYLLVYSGPFTWTQDLAVPADLVPGDRVLRFAIRLQVCNGNCVPGVHRFEVPVTVTDAPPVAATEAIGERLKEPEVQVVSVPGSPSREGAAPAPPAPVTRGPAAETPAAVPMPDTAEEHQANLDALLGQVQVRTEMPVRLGLLAFALQGAGWGILSLLTPCVFPMIPITVSLFLKQSEKRNYRPLTLAVIYSGTIVVVLTIAAVALLSFFRWLSVNPLMNFGLGALFIYFALSLFGMYDIQLPSFLTRFTSAREGQGGVVGTVFMALTFTLVSFACVAPFLGGFGGTAAGSGITFWHRLVGGLAFATAFASPFFVLALFPGLLRRLPRSGSWMNTVKVVMGFLEFAAALKFLRAGELVLLPQAAFFTYELVLGMYVVLAVLCGLYLLGVFRLPHDEPAESIGVPRFVLALLFLSLGLYLAPALFRTGSDGQNHRPSGKLYAWIDSFLLPERREGAETLAWGGNLKAAVDDARQDARSPGRDARKLVFVDFTGETCTNCKLNEQDVFPNPEIQELLKRYRLVKMYTDIVPAGYYSAAVRGRSGGGTERQHRDAAANLSFQRAAFDTEQLPLYVILEPRPEGDVKVVARYDEGKINDPAAFVDFLRKPLSGEAR